MKNLPASWSRMSFINRMYYLVNSHQTKNLSTAAKMITEDTDRKLRAFMQKQWYNKD